MSRNEYIVVDRVLAFIFGICALTMCARPTLAQCPNDVCEMAIELTPCEPIPFENYDCTTDYINVLTHPLGNTHCGGTQHQSGQWFTITTTEFAWWQMHVNSNFTSGAGSGNYGALEGIQWSVANGTCDDLEWIAASSCPTWPERAFCPSPVWSGAVNLAPCPNPMRLIPFWHAQDPVFYPSGTWIPYDPTKQTWTMLLPLPAGTYYFLLSGFLAGNHPSEGSGTIELCKESPLSLRPALIVKETQLSWEGNTQTDWAIFRHDGEQFVEIGRTINKTFKINETGYYMVASSHGFSNIAYARIEIIRKLNYNVLGQTWRD